MALKRVAFGIAYLYLSLAVLGRSFLEASPDRSPDTAIALEENQSLAENSRGFTSALGLQEQHRIPILHFHPASQERRSLRNVQFMPPEVDDTLKEQKSGRRLDIAATVNIFVSGVFLLLFVAVLVFWCYRKKKNDPVEWRLLDSFKRKTPQTDQVELYDQIKGDTHLSG